MITNKEAIEILKIERDHMTPTLFAERIEAMDMAISALQAQDLQSTCNQLATDTISRQAAIGAMCELMHHWFGGDPKDEIREIKRELENLPSAQKKGYTKADYIMALHKEYGCSLARAEEAHQKALEYLRNTSIIKR